MKKLVLKFILITIGYLGSVSLAGWILEKIYDFLINPISKEIEERRI